MCENRDGRATGDQGRQQKVLARHDPNAALDRNVAVAGGVGVDSSKGGEC